MSAFQGADQPQARTFVLDLVPHLLLPLRTMDDIADLHAWAAEAQMPLGDLVYSVLSDAMCRSYGAR